MAKKVALVVGATGISGRKLIENLESDPGWEVIGLSRRAPDFETKARFLSVDVTDRDGTRAAFAQIPNVTHIFYVAYIDAAGWLKQGAINTQMFHNVIDAAEANFTGLQHVCLIQGSKYYGQHLGPYKTPAREDDARHMPPNHYYNQQDYLEERSRASGWSWSCARPHVICGYALGFPLSIIANLAVYAAISKELGLPLRYPGKAGAYETIYQATDAGLLARAMIWMASTPECANQAFNITNGDYFRYKNLWPKLAQAFDMEVGPVQTISLKDVMSDKEDLWMRMQEKYGLVQTKYSEVANWQFADYALSCDWDVMSNTNKCRKFGFFEFIDTEDMYIDQIMKFRENKIIP